MAKKKKASKKEEELIKLDTDLSFDEVMGLIVNAPKDKVDKALKEHIKKKDLEEQTE